MWLRAWNLSNKQRRSIVRVHTGTRQYTWMRLMSNDILRGIVVVDLENHCPSSKWKMRRFQNFNTILLFIPMEFIKMGIETCIFTQMIPLLLLPLRHYRLCSSSSNIVASLLFCLMTFLIFRHIPLLYVTEWSIYCWRI